MAATTPDGMKVGDRVKVRHPLQAGVVREGTVKKIRVKHAVIDFGRLGSAKVPYRDIVRVV